MENKNKFGFVALVGPTNSGKSTLLNSLIGKKISITSPRPQTTYHTIRGILNRDSSQIVFTDMPGYQRQSEPIMRLLNEVADRSAKECDLMTWVFDASNAKVLAQIEKLKKRIAQLKPQKESFCVLNKVDLVPKPKLLPLLQTLFEMNLFSEIIPISAKKNDGVDRLASLLDKYLPEGQPMFPPDLDTDRGTDFLISELIREKIYRTTRQEIPYSVRVEIEHWETNEDDKKVPTIHAILHSDSDSRKKILIGKMGHQLKEIGIQARADIEKLLGKHVCLKLFVDVEHEWRKDANSVHRYLELA